MSLTLLSRPRPAWLAAALAAPLLLWIGAPSEHSTAEPARTRAAAEVSPRVRLCVSGMLEGRLEPCGCASGQMGGLARRVFHIQRVKGYDVLIEGGNLVKGHSELDLEKLSTALMALTMAAHYDAMGIGPIDLGLPLDRLFELLEGFEAPAVASDLVAKDGARIPLAAFRETRVRGVAVRVASLAMSLPEDGARRLDLLSPEEGWRRALEGATPDTLRILLAHADPDRALQLTRLAPKPDLLVIVTAKVAEPPSQPEYVNGVPVVFPGIRGRMLLDLILTRLDGKPSLTRYHIVRLVGSETAKGALEDRDVREMLLAHRHQVKELGLRETLAERLPTAEGRRYVGSKACADCHEEAYESWKRTVHARAWQTLEEAETGRYGWPVTHYPDCVSCHTVGYGYRSGFVSPRKTPDLAGVGCEACHGPGSEHVEEMTAETILRGDPADCRHCHDFEQSPRFDYAERWKKIEHR